MSLIHAEYLKMSRRRLFPTMALILIVLMGITGFFLMAFGRIAPELAGDIPILSKPQAYLLGAQQVASQTWFPVILAVIMLGGEMSTTAWATSLTREPRRLRQVMARLGVFTVAGGLGFVIGLATWVLIAWVAAPGSGVPGVGEWLGVLWRFGVISIAWTSIGLGAVATLRSTGPAIGAALALAFGEGILALWEPYGNVSLSAASSGLFGFVFGPGLDAFIPGSGLSIAHALGILAGWTLLGLALAWWGLQRRDA